MSLPCYSEYKPSGVEWLGDVPGHWEVKPIKAVSSCNDAVLEESTSPDYEIEYIEISGVDAIRGISETTVIPFGNAPSRARRRVADGDILVSTVRTYLRAIAPVTNPPTNMIASTGFAVIRPRHIEPSFLGFIFQAEFLIAEIIARSVGVSYPAINASDLMRLDMPIPTREEQQAIATFLDRETGKIDALIAEQRRLMELLKEKRHAVISHAVTQGLNPHAPACACLCQHGRQAAEHSDAAGRQMKPSGTCLPSCGLSRDRQVEWQGVVPEHWEVGPLKRYWSVTDCKHVTAEFVEDGIPLASIREVQSRWVTLENAKYTTEYFYELLIEGGRRPLPGDLIFSRNATVGEVAQVSSNHPRFAMGQDVVLLRKLAPEYSSDYLQHVIRSPIIILQLANMMIGSTFKRINVEDIRSFIVPFPPYTEQAEIAAFLDAESAKFDTLTAEANRAIDLLQERRSALISAAVTGKIDVREVEN